MQYPLVNIQKAIENGPFIVDLPMKMVIFHSYGTVYQRVFGVVTFALSRETSPSYYEDEFKAIIQNSFLWR